MANNTVAITLTIDEANALKAWTSQQAAVEKLKQKLAALKVPENPMAPLQAGAMKALSTIGQVVVALTGISGAIAAIMALANQLKAEYQNLKAQQNASGGAQIAYAEVLANTMGNVQNLMPVGEFDARARASAARLGQSPSKVTAAIGSSLGASGPDTEADVIKGIENTETILKSFPMATPEDVADLTGSINDLMKQYGIGVEEALGFALELAKQNRSVTIKALAKGVIPGVAAVGSYEKDMREAGAFVDVMSQFLMDPDADVTKTSSREVAEGLADRYPQIKGLNARIKKASEPKEMQKLLEGGVFDRGDMPDKKFEPMTFGKSSAKEVFKALATKGSTADVKYQQFREGIAKADFLKAGDEFAAQNAASPVIQQARLDQQFKSRQEQVQLSNINRGTGGISREGLTKMLDAAGISDIGKKLAIARYEMASTLGSKDQVGAVAKQMENLALDFEAPVVSEWVSGPSAGMGAPGGYERKSRDRNAATPEGKQTGEQLRGLAQDLMRQNEELKMASLAARQSEMIVKAKDALAGVQSGTPASKEELAALKAGEKSLKEMRAGAPAASVQNSDKSIEVFTQLLRQIEKLNDNLGNNSKVTDENTKSLPKPGTTPTPRPPNVSSLQNKRS